jgi:hypothetical protein
VVSWWSKTPTACTASSYRRAISSCIRRRASITCVR